MQSQQAIKNVHSCYVWEAEERSGTEPSDYREEMQTIAECQLENDCNNEGRNGYPQRMR